MFFRRADFLAVGGCDPTLLVMEEADLCIRFHRLGRTHLVNRVVITSDRRVAAWGALRANWIYLKVRARLGLGFRKGLERHYLTCAEPFARGTEALGAEKGERASGRQGCKKSGPTAHPRAAIAKDTPGAIEASMPVPLKAGAEASRDP
jgi:hypothetical protein